MSNNELTRRLIVRGFRPMEFATMRPRRISEISFNSCVPNYSMPENKSGAQALMSQAPMGITNGIWMIFSR